MQNIYDDMWSYGLKIIESRPHSRTELANKMKEKFDDHEMVSQVIEEMQRLHLLNDRLFAEQLIHHLTQKNIGRLKIMYEAKRRGLSDEMAEQALMNIGWSEEGAMKKAIREKERVLGNIEPRKKKQKLLSFLRNRGFSERAIYGALRNES